MYVSHVDRFRNGLNLDPGSHICCTRIEGFEVRQRRRMARIYCNLVGVLWGGPDKIRSSPAGSGVCLNVRSSLPSLPPLPPSPASSHTSTPWSPELRERNGPRVGKRGDKCQINKLLERAARFAMHLLAYPFAKIPAHSQRVAVQQREDS